MTTLRSTFNKLADVLGETGSARKSALKKTDDLTAFVDTLSDPALLYACYRVLSNFNAKNSPARHLRLMYTWNPNDTGDGVFWDHELSGMMPKKVGDAFRKKIVDLGGEIFTATSENLEPDSQGEMLAEVTLEGLTRKVRRTNENPPRAVLYEFIAAVKSCGLDYANKIYSRLLKEGRVPECEEVEPNLIRTNCPDQDSRDLRVESGHGGGDRKLVRVATAEDLNIILMALPGNFEFKKNISKLVTRYLGGDETLISEIHRNRTAQERLARDDPEHPARIYGETVEAAATSEKVADTSFESKLRALELRKQIAETEEAERVAELNKEAAEHVKETKAAEKRAAETFERTAGIREKSAKLESASGIKRRRLSEAAHALEHATTDADRNQATVAKENAMNELIYGERVYLTMVLLQYTTLRSREEASKLAGAFGKHVKRRIVQENGGDGGVEKRVNTVIDGTGSTKFGESFDYHTEHMSAIIYALRFDFAPRQTSSFDLKPIALEFQLSDFWLRRIRENGSQLTLNFPCGT